MKEVILVCRPHFYRCKTHARYQFSDKTLCGISVKGWLFRNEGVPLAGVTCKSCLAKLKEGK